MMDHCLQIAVDEGFDTVWLGVWEHNPKAARFYEKCGFQVFGSHAFWVGNDCQTDNLMKLQLP
jgi:ribosomal protein S18 acetylase RimI-like enzyme